MGMHPTVRHLRELKPPPFVIQICDISRNEERYADADCILAKPLLPHNLRDTLSDLFSGTIPARDRGGEKQQFSSSYRLHSIQGARLLLVDDHPSNIMVAKGLLLNAGINVETAENGRQAVELIKSGIPFDAVFMDVRMPVMDGYEATRLIREAPSFAGLPIIAMTADAMPGDRERSLSAGMNDHLAKPVDVDELHEKLLKWIPSKTEPVAFQKTIPSQKTEMIPGRERLEKALTGFSIDVVLKRLDNDFRLFTDLLAVFCKDLPKRLAEMNRAEKKGDRETLILQAHTIKGMAGNVGADAVFHAAIELETGLNEGTGGNYGKRLEVLYEEANKALSAAGNLSEIDHENEHVSRPGIEEKTPPEDDTSVKILLVDDDDHIRLIVPTLLQKVPHSLTAVEDGEKALNVFKAASHDLVLMDMQMPVMNGYTATAKMREWERNTGKAPTPIIGITANNSPQDIQKMRDAGCDEHLVKPLSKKRLVAAVRQAVFPIGSD